MTALPMSLMTDDEVARFGAPPNDSCFGALRTERGLLPLAAMDVDARITGIVAAIEVAQTFVNTTGTAIEATYMFPLPDRAAVHRFRMQIGERTIEGLVEERGRAREQYDEAIATGHRAAITEEERPGVFTMRVGNIMPGESATVRLSLVGPLPVDDGEITFRFPLVVAPRYIPGTGLGGEQAGLGIAEDTNLVPDASRISPPVRLPGCPNPVRLGLRVAITDPSLADLASSLHAVTLSNRDARVIEVLPGERLDRDFILRWRISGAALTSTLACADDADGTGGTFMLTFVPPATTTLGAKPRDVVFVIDRSGSMEGWKMVAARRAAARMIDTLTSRDRFCAMAFDNTIEELPEPGLVAATDRARFRAVEALGKVEARGGTELMEPLRRGLAILAGGTDDRERVLVLVTDGQVGNEDHILRELAPHVKNVRVFTLGIDQAVNAAFLRRLAGAGGGLCELVESEDRLDVVMAKVHRRIGMPIAIDLALSGSAIELDASTFAPKKLPDVYAGAPVTILGRYRGRLAASAAIEITGTSLGDPLSLRVAQLPVDGATSAWLGASWARARIRDLEDAYAATANDTLEQQIVATSKRYSVLSRFTAFLAVDRAEIVNRGGALAQVVQPVEAPAGWASLGNAAPPPPPVNSPRARMAAPRGAPMRSAAMPAPSPASAPPANIGPSAGALGGKGGGGYGGGAVDGKSKRESEEQRDSARSFEAERTATKSAMPAEPPAPPKLVARKVRAAPPKDMAPSTELDALAAVGSSAATVDAYRTKLAAFARELEAQAHGRNDAAAIRVIRQRLTEWVEDVRSVGGDAALAAEVERLIVKLTAALASGTPVASDVLAVAVALAALSTGGGGGGGATPSTRGGRAFWK